MLDEQIRRGYSRLSPNLIFSLDSTGWDSHYVSRYFLKRHKRSKTHRPWIKSTLVCDNRTHLITALVLGRGPGNDAAFFPTAIRQAAQRLTPICVLADSAHDAEPFHRLCRLELGIPRTAIPINPRNTNPRRIPRSRFRRQMRLQFPKRLYRQRSHAECVMSQIKRRLGPNLCGRSNRSRQWETQLKILSFNALLLAQPQSS